MRSGRLILVCLIFLPLVTPSLSPYHQLLAYYQLSPFPLQPLYQIHQPAILTHHVYQHHHEPVLPVCAINSTKSWCLVDPEYPEYELKHAIQQHFYTFTSLYADVSDLDTRLSVSRPRDLADETYLCPSKTSYVRPLRAKNTAGKWRVIVNNIKANYETYTQTTRIEECLTAGEQCPFVPLCHQSKCLQKRTYHRFLVYDPYDHHFPFAIETFRLPSSCACLLGAYFI